MSFNKLETILVNLKILADLKDRDSTKLNLEGQFFVHDDRPWPWQSIWRRVNGFTGFNSSSEIKTMVDDAVEILHKALEDKDAVTVKRIIEHLEAIKPGLEDLQKTYETKGDIRTKNKLALIFDNINIECGEGRHKMSMPKGKDAVRGYVSADQCIPSHMFGPTSH